MSDHVYNTYVRDIEVNNRSQYIEEQIIKASENDLGANEINKQRLLHYIRENDALQAENRQLKAQLEKVKAHNPKKAIAIEGLPDNWEESVQKTADLMEACSLMEIMKRFNKTIQEAKTIAKIFCENNTNYIFQTNKVVRRDKLLQKQD